MEHSKNTFLPGDLITGNFQMNTGDGLVYFEKEDAQVPCHFYFRESKYSPNAVVGYRIDMDFENEDAIQHYLFAEQKEKGEHSLLEMMFKGFYNADYAVCIRTPHQLFLLRSILQAMMTWELMDQWERIFKVLEEKR